MFTKKKPLEIKKQTVSVPAKPAGSNSSLFARSPRPTKPLQRPGLTQSRSPLSASRSKPRPSHNPSAAGADRRPSPATPLSAKRKRTVDAAPDFGTDDESEEEDQDAERAREQDAKRRKRKELRALYKDRRIRSHEAFNLTEGGRMRTAIVHAAEIPARDRTTKYEPYFATLEEGWVVKLQYPSLCEQEQYMMMHAPHDSQGYDPIQDITEVMHKVIDYFIPEEEQDQFTHESSGFAQRLHRAAKKKSQTDIAAVIDEWNNALTKACENGSVSRTIDEMLRPDPPLVERIINQTHARTVSLNLKALHEYEAGTDNVYGELLPKFVSKILEDTLLGPDAVFVDLGSGVGNVVLQAALEAGCESWGCEMMEKYCDVAELQHQEFVARCKLWGFEIGAIHLERGDFLANVRVHEALRRADVVLVNNQVFTPQTNEALTTLFLDLKDGCRVVSLKSFVPAGHRINVRNSQSPYSILGDIKEKEYFSKSVSWTDQGGKYFISTKDQNFLTSYNASGG